MKRASRRPRRNPSSFPWDDKIVPIDASDLAYMSEVEQIESQRGREAAARFVLGRENRRFYRRNQPRLGEPVFKSEASRARGTTPSMYCGRGTGHLGSGLYFFGTLRAALDGASPSSVFRVIGGPRNPYIARTRDDTRKLHAFGKALLCYPDEFLAYGNSKRDLEERTARLASLERYSDAWHDLDDEIAAEKDNASALLRDLKLTARKIQFDGPQWEQPEPRSRGSGAGKSRRDF